MPNEEIVILDEETLVKLSRLLPKMEKLLTETHNEVPPQGESRFEVLPCANFCGEEVPAYGTVYFDRLHVEETRTKVYKPYRDCMVSIGVSTGVLFDTMGSPGRCKIAGVTLVRVSDWATIRSHRRIGAVAYSYDQKENPMGPMIVIARAADPLVWALFLRRRGGSLLVGNCGTFQSQPGTVLGNFEHLHFSASHILSQTDYGKVHVAPSGATGTGTL